MQASSAERKAEWTEPGDLADVRILGGQHSCFPFLFFFFLLSIDYQRRDMYGRLDHESSADGLANIQTTADMDSWGDD